MAVLAAKLPADLAAAKLMADLRASADDPLLYGITGFSAANFLASDVFGGETGDAAGFGAVAQIVVNRLSPAANQCIFGRTNSSDKNWAIYRTTTNTIVFGARNGADTVLVLSGSYTLSPSDVGRVLTLAGWHDGTAVRMMVSRGAPTSPVAISGYTYTPGVKHALGALGAGMAPASDVSILSHATFRGTPSTTQLDDYLTRARALGDLPTTIQGGTVTHRYSVRDQLRALGGAVTSGQTAPATLDDTITRAAADALARQGSPTVVTIDTSRDGRRTLGVSGWSAANAYEGPAGSGAFTPSGSWLAWYGTIGGTSSSSTPWLFDGAFAVRGTATNWASVSLAASASTTAFDFSKVYAAPFVMVCVYTGTSLRWFVDTGSGPQQVGADVAATLSPSQPIAFGRRVSNTAQHGDNHSWFGSSWGVIVGGPTTQQVTDLCAAIRASGRIQGIPGATLHLWDPQLDVAAAGESAPAQILDRIGTDHLTRVGTGLQVAQRTERTWSYETSPIYYGASGFGAGDQYSYADGFVGDASGFWVLLWYIVTSQSVTSATRILLGCGGWDIRTSLTHSTIGLGFMDGSSSYTIVGTTALAAADVGKVQCFGFCWDGAAQQVRPFNKRSALAATGRSGYTPAPGPLNFGRVLSWPADAGISLLGCAMGFGAPANAEFLAAYDAGMAQERVVGVAGRTSTLIDLTLDAKSNGGVLPAVLADRAGGGRALTRTGSVTTTPHYARAFGW